jgi:hypothetical protein
MRNILTFLLLLSLSANAQSVNTTTNTTNWKKYEGAQYSVEYPSNWTVKEPDANAPFLYFFSALRSTEDKFQENVNIIHQSMAGLNMTLDTFVQVSLDQIKSMLANAEVTESKRLQHKGGEYHKLIYRGDMGTYNLIFEQYYVLAGSDVYVITFTSEQDQFDTYKSTAERVLNSFRLKG